MPDGQPLAAIVDVPLDGDREPTVLVDGPDFLAAPRLSPDGARLAWLEWDHPDMPWDATRLRVAPILEDGTLGPSELAAGGPEESIVQPEWSPDGILHLVSDRSGWWNLYRILEGPRLEPLGADGGGVRRPVVDLRPLVVRVPGRRLDRGGGPDRRPRPPVPHPAGRAGGRGRVAVHRARRAADRARRPVVAIAGSPSEAALVATFDPVTLAPVRRPATVQFREPRPGLDLAARADRVPLDRRPHRPRPRLPAGQPGLRRPRRRAPAAGRPLARRPDRERLDRARPRDPAAHQPRDRGRRRRLRRQHRLRPRLPRRAPRRRGASSTSTTASRPPGSSSIAATSTGSASPSTAAARAATRRSRPSPSATSSRRGSATSGSATSRRSRATPTSSSRATWTGSSGRTRRPAAVYRQRSPVHYLDEISCPVLVLQGPDDQIVPPAQAEAIVAALAANRIPHAYLAFAGEGHGFRGADAIRRSLEAELSFLGRRLRLHAGRRDRAARGRRLDAWRAPAAAVRRARRRPPGLTIRRRRADGRQGRHRTRPAAARRRDGARVPGPAARRRRIRSCWSSAGSSSGSSSLRSPTRRRSSCRRTSSSCCSCRRSCSARGTSPRSATSRRTRGRSPCSRSGSCCSRRSSSASSSGPSCPSLQWAPAFALGAIVAPPDAVAATSVLRRLGVPRRVVTILEGESLVNDASALIAYRVAVAAVVDRLVRAAGRERLVRRRRRRRRRSSGIVIGWRHHRRPGGARATRPSSRPVAHRARRGLSHRRERSASAGSSRPSSPGSSPGGGPRACCRPTAGSSAAASGPSSSSSSTASCSCSSACSCRSCSTTSSSEDPAWLVGLAVAVCLTVILARIVWVFPATYLPRILSKRIRAARPGAAARPRSFVIAWAGHARRRVAGGGARRCRSRRPFPERDLIIYLTFCVILATLVGQGLTLPWRHLAARARRRARPRARGDARPPDGDRRGARCGSRSSPSSTPTIWRSSTSSRPGSSTRPTTSTDRWRRGHRRIRSRAARPPGDPGGGHRGRARRRHPAPRRRRDRRRGAPPRRARPRPRGAADRDLSARGAAP